MKEKFYMIPFPLETQILQGVGSEEGPVGSALVLAGVAEAYKVGRDWWSAWGASHSVGCDRFLQPFLSTLKKPRGRSMIAQGLPALWDQGQSKRPKQVNQARASSVLLHCIGGLETSLVSIGHL